MNRALPGIAYATTTRGNSHFMGAETTIEMFQSLFLPSFHLRREKLGRARERKGGVWSDGFSGNTAWRAGEDVRRERVLAQMNALAIPLPPSGWSAHGSVCDGCHAQLRGYQKKYEDLLIALE